MNKREPLIIQGYCLQVSFSVGHAFLPLGRNVWRCLCPDTNHQALRALHVWPPRESMIHNLSSSRAPPTFFESLNVLLFGCLGSLRMHHSRSGLSWLVIVFWTVSLDHWTKAWPLKKLGFARWPFNWRVLKLSSTGNSAKFKANTSLLNWIVYCTCHRLLEKEDAGALRFRLSVGCCGRFHCRFHLSFWYWSERCSKFVWDFCWSQSINSTTGLCDSHHFWACWSYSYWGKSFRYAIRAPR